MPRRQVFLSHSSQDDVFVAALREALENLDVPVWVDSRRLRGGDALAPEILRAIGEARFVVAVLSPRTVNSPWVRREIRHALEVRKTRDDDYRVVPLLLPGIEQRALDVWFDEEPVAVRVPEGPLGLQEALPGLAEALGLALPDDFQASIQPKPPPVAELVLELEDPGIDTSGGQHRPTATAQLVFHPPEGSGEREVRSRRFRYTAPIGPIEAGEIAWYLERYSQWPSGVFRERARGIEEKLDDWGRLLASRSSPRPPVNPSRPGNARPRTSADASPSSSTTIRWCLIPSPIPT